MFCSIFLLRIIFDVVGEIFATSVSEQQRGACWKFDVDLVVPFSDVDKFAALPLNINTLFPRARPRS